MAEKIKAVKARMVLDSRGNPTVEAEVHSQQGFSRAIVPSGASKGKYEALELRDKGKTYLGKNVSKAVKNVNKIIAPKLKGKNLLDQEEIDALMIELDGTPNKTKLGANAMLAVSMACARQAALSQKLPLYVYLAKIAKRKGVTLPLPQFNVVNGGKHAGLENDIQEHSLVPVKAKNFSEALRMSVEVYHYLGVLLKKTFHARATLLGDEGGFVPPLKSVRERLEFMQRAIDLSGYSKEFAFALDAAASEFAHNGRYALQDKIYSSEELIDYFKDLTQEFRIVSLEDALAEDDWTGWAVLTKELGSKVQVLGDDLLVSNPERIKQAIQSKACNALLLKVNQVGTVSEALESALMALKAGWKLVVSHRSGETEDAFIADLAVGLDAGQCKFGAPARSERNAKYNQLLRLEEALGKKARFPRLF